MVTHEFKINYYVLRKTGLYLTLNLLKYCGNPQMLDHISEK